MTDEPFQLHHHRLGADPAAILRDLAAALRDASVAIDRANMAGWLEAVADDCGAVALNAAALKRPGLVGRPQVSEEADDG